jgi:hypothetical protein
VSAPSPDDSCHGLLPFSATIDQQGKSAAAGSTGSSALTLYDYQQQQAGIGAPVDPAAAQHKGPAIIYSSRTHSQLAQVVKELRNTSYRCASHNVTGAAAAAAAADIIMLLLPPISSCCCCC